MTQVEAPRASPGDDDGLVPGAEFNVREYGRTAIGSHRGQLDLQAYARQPLDTETLELVDYLARLEQSTMRHLRSVLVTPTHKDSRVTAFLITWAYEKYWLADALEVILSAHPHYEGKAAHRIPLPLRAWRSFTERIEPMHESVVANAIGEDVVAVHTMTGAVDEWITQAAYASLSQLTVHPEFEKTLAALLQVKERHEVFWSAQSRDRLARAPKAAPLTRRRLSRTRWPLGAIEESPELTVRFFSTLFDEASIAAIDARIEAYPGLAGLGLLHTAAAGRPGHIRAARWIGRTAATLANSGRS